MSETIDIATTLVIHAAAKNDANGNPRRCYLVVDRAGFAMAIDEGYSGDRAIDAELGPELGRELRGRVTGRLEVSPRDYKSLLRDFGAGGVHRRRFPGAEVEDVRTAEGKRAFIIELVDSVRDKLLSRVDDMPESWDGHELREIISTRFSNERTMTRINVRSYRAQDYAREVARRNL